MIISELLKQDTNINLCKKLALKSQTEIYLTCKSRTSCIAFVTLKTYLSWSAWFTFLTL